VTLHEGARVTGARAGSDGGILLELDGGTSALAGSHVLVATGRRPAIEGLGLEEAGIASDKDGIIVDKGLRTANRRVFAIGDCVSGAPRFTHVANDHAGLVLRAALFRAPVSTIGRVVPRVTYCDPEVASVGLSEDDAVAREKGVRILRWPFAENDRAQAERRTEGLIKVVVAKNGRVLGATIVGAGAGDLLAPWTSLVARKGKLSEAAGLIVPYPTMGEVTRRVAVSDLMPMASRPWLRRVLAFLRRFG
jgi:pyruvate/2-oxoglutarate dehydrogenase complex dihydrolipoamide dehydrogenase (E3) component